MSDFLADRELLDVENTFHRLGYVNYLWHGVLFQ